MFSFSQQVGALEDIFSVPSYEVVEKGELFLQHESAFRAWDPEPYWEGNNSAAVGVGHNTQLNAILFNAKVPKAEELSVGLGFKSVVPVFKKEFPERDFKLTIGDVVPFSLRGKGVGNWGYAHFSGTVPKVKTRLAAGLSAGTEQVFGRNVVSFIATYEQPITKKLELIGDWYSGTHNRGFLITGFGYEISKHLDISVGYQIPNNKKCGRSGFVMQLEMKF